MKVVRPLGALRPEIPTLGQLGPGLEFDKLRAQRGQRRVTTGELYLRVRAMETDAAGEQLDLLSIVTTSSQK